MLVVTAFVVPSVSLKLPEVIELPDIVAAPPVPAVLDLNGPCTPPPDAEAPPPAASVNKLPVDEPDNVVLVPALELPLYRVAIALLAAPPDPIE